MSASDLCSANFPSPKKEPENCNSSGEWEFLESIKGGGFLRSTRARGRDYDSLTAIDLQNPVWGLGGRNAP